MSTSRTSTNLPELPCVSKGLGREDGNLVPRVLVPLTSGQEKERLWSNQESVKFDGLLKSSLNSLVLCFIFISLTSRECCPKHCGRALLWRKNPPYISRRLAVLRTVCLLYTVVSRSGLVHSQNTAHARVVIQPEPG